MRDIYISLILANLTMEGAKISHEGGIAVEFQDMDTTLFIKLDFFSFLQVFFFKADFSKRKEPAAL